MVRNAGRAPARAYTPPPDTRMSSRPLIDFLRKLPRDTLSLAIRIGESKSPRDAGYVNLSDWGGIDALDFEGLTADLFERFEAGGWPGDWPTVKVEAKPEAGGAGKMSTSWQDTGGKSSDRSAPAGPGDAYMEATKLASRALEILGKGLESAQTALANARIEADNARIDAVNAHIERADAEMAAEKSAFAAEMAGNTADPNMERGASALEKLGDAIVGKMTGAAPPLTAEELIQSMDASPDFVDSLFDDPRAEALVAAAMARRAKRSPPPS